MELWYLYAAPVAWIAVLAWMVKDCANPDRAKRLRMKRREEGIDVRPTQGH